MVIIRRWFKAEISLFMMFFLCFSLIFKVFININEYALAANNIICIFDHRIKDLCLSFNLVPSLVAYDK